MNDDIKDIEAWFSRGNHLRETGRSRDAIFCYKKIINVKPDTPEAYNNIGTIFSSRGETSKAITCFQKAVDIDPGFGEAYYNLGNAYSRIGDSDSAITSYQNSLKINPYYLNALINLGNLLLKENDLDGAIDFYQRALLLQSDHSGALCNMGNALKQKGKIEDAFNYYNKAIKFTPDLVQALNGKGNLYLEQERIDDAIVCFKEALQINPSFIEAYNNLGLAYKIQGRIDKAVSCFSKMLELKYDFGVEIKMAMLHPILCTSKEEMLHIRNELDERLDFLKSKNLRLEDPYKQVGVTNFLLALHGVNEKDMRQKIASFYLDICPNLVWESPYLKKSAGKGRIRIGFVSRYLYDHTIGNLYRGIIKKLSREKFEVIVFRLPSKEDEISESICKAADKVVNLPDDLWKSRQIIAEHLLDILFFPEIGMDPLTYFIAFSRLAKVQCKRGFPITSGIPNIDYFISSDAAEPVNAKEHYSESLVRLKTTGLYYYWPDIPEYSPSRQKLGLPEGHNIYACPQSIFKLHPDFDYLLGEILHKDPKGILLLIEGKHEYWKDLLINRFKRIFPDAIDRIIFAPQLPRKDFISLFLVADAVLDTIHFSGGNTSLECFACGIPVVTWPSPLLPGRLTYGYYKQMGIMDCVADTFDSYVEIALRLANNSDWRNHIKDKIKAASYVLFENMNSVSELEIFFEQAVKKIPGGHFNAQNIKLKAAGEYGLPEDGSGTIALNSRSLNSNEIYKKNLEILAINFPDVHQLLKQNQESFSYSPKTFATKNGLSNILFSLPDGNKIPFYLEDDIEYNADQIMSDWNLEQQDFLFCVGMGLGYIPLIHLKKYKSKPRIIIMEPEISVFNMAMQLVDLRALLNYKKLDIFIGYNYNLLKILNNYGFDLFFGKQRVLTHAASRIIFGKKFLDFESEIKAAIGTVRDTLYTTKEMGRDIFSNTIMNLPSFFSSISLGELRGRFSGFTAFCVAAGPSLDSAIDDLKQIGNRGLIIAIDSAVPALLQAGIVPHMVVTADARKENIEKYRAYLDQLRNTVLVFGVESNPDNIRLFLGKRKLAISIDNPILNNWIGDLWNLDCNLPAMTTVSHGALFTALALGVNAIIMVGMDMAFPTGESHSKGAIHRYNFNNVNGLIKVEGTNGLPVYSNRPLTDYRVQIESVLSQSTISFINTSIAGAAVKGVVNKSLKEIIDTLLNESNINEILDSIDWSSAISDAEIISETKLLLQRIEAFKAECLFFEKMALEIIKYFSTCNSKEKMLEQLDTLKFFCKEFDEKNIFIIKIIEGIRIGELKELTLRRYSIESSKSSQNFLKNLEDEIILQRDCFRSHYKAASYFFDLLNNFFIYFHRSISFDKNKSKHINEPVKMIKQARFFADSNELMKSEALYQEYLKKFPDDNEIAIELVDLFKSFELWGLALKEAQTVCRRNTLYKEPLKKLQEVKFEVKSILNDAGQALDKGDNNRARINLMEYKAIFPDDAKALLLEKELRNKEKDTAGRLVNETDNLLSSECLNELETKAKVLMRSGEFEKTAGILEALFSFFPDKKAFYREKIGDMRAIQKDYCSALWNYKEACRMDKESKSLIEKIYWIKDQG